jgi:hypothetical protein
VVIADVVGALRIEYMHTVSGKEQQPGFSAYLSIHSFFEFKTPHDDTISLRTPSEHCLQCYENTTVVIRTV